MVYSFDNTYRYQPPQMSPYDYRDEDNLLFDFTKKLDGATISSVIGVSGTPSGLNLRGTAVLPVSGVSQQGVAVTFSSGQVNVIYEVTCAITTSDSRTLYRSLILPCQTR